MVPEFGSFSHLCCPCLASSMVACLSPLALHLLRRQSLCLPQCFTLLCESLDATCPSVSAPFYASLREEHQPLLDRLLQGSLSEHHASPGSTGGSSQSSPPGASQGFPSPSSPLVPPEHWQYHFQQKVAAQIAQPPAAQGSPVPSLTPRPPPSHCPSLTSPLLASSPIQLPLSAPHPGSVPVQVQRWRPSQPMTRASVWQSFTQPRWLLPAASPWRGTAVGTPRSRSGQLSLQGTDVQSPGRQQPFAGESLFQQ